MLYVAPRVMIRWPAKQFVALAWLTALEAVRQPICLLLAITGIVLISLMPALVLHQMGDAQKLIRDSAMATHFLGGLLLAGYAACAAVQHEIRRGTAAVVLSKPVGRSLFLLAKFAGVAAVLVWFSAGAMVATLLSDRMTRLSYSIDWWAGGPLLAAIGLALVLAGAINYFTQRSFMSVAFGLLVPFMALALVSSSFVDEGGRSIAFGAMVTWKLVPGSLLITMALLVLAGLAVSLATRLDTVPTLCLCTVIFLLGLMSDYLFGRVADHNRLAALLYGLLPNWQHFWMTDALSGEGIIPWSYVGQVGVYGAFYLAGVLTLGILAFRRMELRG
ncbi:ABC transporter permease subunit [bacterium]|nr:ABC transporter permease subunit [bacterium]